jgi:endo-1,4-beta-xylanase
MFTLMAALVLQNGLVFGSTDFIRPNTYRVTPDIVVENGIISATTDGSGANIWSTTFSKPLPNDLPSGGEVEIRFTGRSKNLLKVSAILELSNNPYTKFASSDFQLTPEWTTFSVKGRLEQTLIGGTSMISFHFNHGKGLSQIKDVSFTCSGYTSAPSVLPAELLTDQWNSEGANKPTVKISDEEDITYGKITKISFNNPGNPWDSQYGQVINKKVLNGNVLFAKVWLRGKGGVSAVFEQSAPPNEKDLFEAIKISDQWKEYTFPVLTSRSYAAGGSQFKLFFSGAGTVEIGKVSLYNFTDTKPIGSLALENGLNTFEADKVWRKSAQASIEKIRKGNVVISVFDSKGKPVRNATVKLKQTNSLFRFGTAVPASLLTAKTDDAERFRAVVKENFNIVTFDNDLKWGNSSAEAFPAVIYPAYEWLKSNRIQLRGHNLVWGSFKYSPIAAATLSKEELWSQIKAHVEDYATKMKGKVYVWDGVNEAYTETEIWDKVGWDKFAEVYKIARKIDPNAKLAYNDFNISNGNDKQRDGAIARANQIKDDGGAVDYFGDQSHLSGAGVPGQELWRNWDIVAEQTGLPIEITEFDFTSRNDAFQAAYTEEFFTAAFAHPKIESLIMWGFWENAHWLSGQGGHSVRADWTWRDSMKVINRLITKDWRTNGEFKTDKNGKVSIPAFYGDFEVTTAKSTKQFKHVKAGTLVKLAG